MILGIYFLDEVLPLFFLHLGFPEVFHNDSKVY